MLRRATPAILSLIIVLFVSSVSFAGGLSTHFVEITLNKLEPGKTYSVKEISKSTLIINNTTKDKTVDIEIVPEKPVDYNLVPGYEPIPDLSWVKIGKGYFEHIGPGGSAETDISIAIPAGKEYYGKKYQVYIYSHTTGQGTFRVGIMSRLLINTILKP